MRSVKVSFLIYVWVSTILPDEGRSDRAGNVGPSVSRPRPRRRVAGGRCVRPGLFREANLIIAFSGYHSDQAWRCHCQSRTDRCRAQVVLCSGWRRTAAVAAIAVSRRWTDPGVTCVTRFPREGRQTNSKTDSVGRLYVINKLTDTSLKKKKKIKKLLFAHVYITA